MRYYICLFLLFLILAAICFCMVEVADEDDLKLSVVVTAGDREEEIVCWKNIVEDEVRYYAFLPSYAELAESVIRIEPWNTVMLDGKKGQFEISLDEFQLNVPYELTYESENGIKQYMLEFVCSSHVATMYIDTASGSMEYIHEAKGNKEPGTIRLYDSDGSLIHGGIVDSLKGRGNSTWDNFDKKPYNFELTEEVDLLDMGAAKKWVLLTNSMDPSHMKNKAIYDFARTIGMRFSPDCEWVDLYLNGEYRGLYLLSEYIEIHNERVDIARQNSCLITQEGFERVKMQNLPYVCAQDGLAMRVRYADMDESAIESIWTSVRNAITAPDGIDSLSGKSWIELIDLDSWALRYLLDEVFANYDGGYLSQYFYYDGSDEARKVHAGPVWDMDLTMGTFGFAWQSAQPYALLAGRRHMRFENDEPLFYALCQKEEFLCRMTELYRKVFRPAVMRLLDEETYAHAERIEQASKMNRARWEYSSIDFWECVEYNCRYLEERMAFLDDLWLKKKKFCFVHANMNDSSVWACFAIRPGERMPTLPQREGYSWYRYDTQELLDAEQPVNEDISVYLAPLPDASVEQIRSSD